MAIDTDYKFKIILLGEPGVGKTSMSRTCTNCTTLNSSQSVVNLTSIELTVKGKKVKLCIWETSSQKWFKNVAPNYYDGVLLVYDITNRQTFNALSDWLTLLRKKSNGAASLVVGNKIDQSDGNAVSRDEALRFTREEDLEFIELSAKNSDDVLKIFEHITLRILQSRNLVPDEEIDHESSDSAVQDQNDELATEQFQQPVQLSERTVQCQNDEHALTAEQLQQPDRNTANDTDHETISQEPQQPSCSMNGNLNNHQAAVSDSDDDDVSFVWVSFLPPIVKLPPDITPLRVGRRRTSADSVLSLMTESEQTRLRFDAEERH